MPRDTHKLSLADAELVAIKAVSFITEDETRLDRFLSLTGWTPDALRQNAAHPAFLAAVLDHLSGDESLLLTFAANTGTDPSLVGRALRAFEKTEP